MSKTKISVWSPLPAAIFPKMSSTSTNSWLPMNNNIIDGDGDGDGDDDINLNRSAIYNTDGKFFLAAVLSLAFVVALVFLLHLCIRRILRRGRHLPDHRDRSTSRRIFVDATSQAQQASSSGLAPSALAAIPTFEYRKVAGAESSAECAVCLSEVEEGEEVRLLPSCKHVFHVGCIDMWLHSHCTCPVCRAGVEPPSKAEEVVQLPTAGACPGGSSSSSSRIGASFRRMLSAKEWSGRRPAHGVGLIEDVERQ